MQFTFIGKGQRFPSSDNKELNLLKRSLMNWNHHASEKQKTALALQVHLADETTKRAEKGKRPLGNIFST